MVLATGILLRDLGFKDLGLSGRIPALAGAGVWGSWEQGYLGVSEN